MAKVAIIIISVMLIIAVGICIFSVLHLRQGLGRRPVHITGQGEQLHFRWHYIAFPAVILLFSVVMVCYFYSQLPAADIAAHFDSGGSPDAWSGRVAVIIWALVPQLVLLLAALGITLGMVKLSTRLARGSQSQIAPEKMVSFMGNILGLPGCVICFKSFDIFWYHVHEVHIVPMWIFLVAVLVIAGVVPLFLAVGAISKGKRTS
jgi:uncharacterized membrane protein